MKIRGATWGQAQILKAMPPLTRRNTTALIANRSHVSCSAQVLHICISVKRLSYRRESARRSMSGEIVPTGAQLHKKIQFIETCNRWMVLEFAQDYRKYFYLIGYIYIYDFLLVVRSNNVLLRRFRSTAIFTANVTVYKWPWAVLQYWHGI